MSVPQFSPGMLESAHFTPKKWPEANIPAFFGEYEIVCSLGS